MNTHDELRSKPDYETAAVVERLRAAYTSWNNPPSDGLPEGAEVVLEAADIIERLSRERGTVPEGWRDIKSAPKGEDVLVAIRCLGGGATVNIGTLLFEPDREGVHELNGERGDWRWSVGDDWQDESEYGEDETADEVLLGWLPLPQWTMLSAAPQPPSVSSEVEMWRQKVAEFAKSHERLQTELEKARDGMQNALADAIKDAISDLDDHAGDDLPTRRFLAGTIDGLKKALFIAVSASPVPQNGEGG